MLGSVCGVLILVLVAAGSPIASAGVIYDNLAGDILTGGFNVGSDPYFQGFNFWQGFRFVAVEGGVVSSLDVIAGHWPTAEGGRPTTMTFQLYADAGGTPGLLLETVAIGITQDFRARATFTGIASGASTVTAGSSYWLFAGGPAPRPPPFNGPEYASIWSQNNTSDWLLRAASFTGQGGSFVVYEMSPAPAFRINSIPEPGTSLLVMTGLAGLAARRRN